MAFHHVEKPYKPDENWCFWTPNLGRLGPQKWNSNDSWTRFGGGGSENNNIFLASRTQISGSGHQNHVILFYYFWHFQARPARLADVPGFGGGGQKIIILFWRGRGTPRGSDRCGAPHSPEPCLDRSATCPLTLRFLERDETSFLRFQSRNLAQTSAFTNISLDVDYVPHCRISLFQFH